MVKRNGEVTHQSAGQKTKSARLETDLAPPAAGAGHLELLPRALHGPWPCHGSSQGWVPGAPLSWAVAPFARCRDLAAAV